MSEYRCVLRVAKLRTMSNIAGSGGHAWREVEAPNADPARTPTNSDLRPVVGSAALVAAVKQRLALATERAKEAVLAIEYMVTAHHAAFASHGGEIDADAYFRDALAWIEARHGQDNVVAARVQRDVLAPLLVAYVVPLVEAPGTKRKRSVIVGTNPDGSKRRETREFETEPAVRLSAAHYIGGRQLLREMQTDFHEKVGRRHGLLRGAPGSQAAHQTVRQYHASLEGARKEPFPEGIAAKDVDGHAVRIARLEAELSTMRHLTEGLSTEQQDTLAAAAETMRAENRRRA